MDQTFPSRPPSALLTLLISHFQKLNHSHFIGLSTVVQQLLELRGSCHVLATKRAPFVSILRRPVPAFRCCLSLAGGLNSTTAGLGNPLDAIGEFKGEYRRIASDLRNAYDGQSSGPLESDRPWDAYTDDHLGVMEIIWASGSSWCWASAFGGPFIPGTLRRAPDRVVAAVLAQAERVASGDARSFL